MTGTRAFAGILAFALSAPVHLVASFLFHVKRDQQPILARRPSLVLLLNFFSLAATASVCLKLILWDDFGCKFDVWQDFMVVLIIGNAYLVRCWLLYFRFEVTHERIQAAEEALGLRTGMLMNAERKRSRDMADEHDPLDRTAEDSATNRVAPGLMPPEPKGEQGSRTNSLVSGMQDHESQKTGKGAGFSFMKNRWLSSWRLVLPVVLVLSLVQLIPLFVLATDSSVPRLAKDNDCQAETAAYRRANLAFILCYLIMFGYFARNLRTVYDRFLIAEEIRNVMVYILVTAVLWAPFRLVKALDDFQTDNLHISALLIVCLFLAILYSSTIKPLYVAMYNPLLARSPEMLLPLTDGKWEEPLKALSTCSDVVNDPLGFEAFQSFLTHEFSVENLLFWREVEVFRSLAGKSRDEAPQMVHAGSEAKENEDSVAIVDDDMLVVEDMVLTEDELFRLAVLIYHRFVAPDSEFEVNLPGNVAAPLKESFGHFAPSRVSLSSTTAGPKTSFRHSIVEKRENVILKMHNNSNAIGLQELDPQAKASRIKALSSSGTDSGLKRVFDDAQNEIFLLMQKDSFPRFLVSQEYRDLVERRVNLQRSHTRTSILQQMKLT